MSTNGTMNGHKSQHETDSKTLLQNAAKPTGEQAEKPQPPKTDKKTSAIAKSTAVENEVNNQAAALVENAKVASEIHLKSGIRDGEADGKAYDAGYKIGLLKSMRKSRLSNTVELSRQLAKLNDFTDATTGETAEETLEKFISSDDQNLEDMLTEMDLELEELLGKKEGTSSKSLLGF